jgi:hypothetical protein
VGLVIAGNRQGGGSGGVTFGTPSGSAQLKRRAEASRGNVAPSGPESSTDLPRCPPPAQALPPAGCAEGA